MGKTKHLMKLSAQIFFLKSESLVRRAREGEKQECAEISKRFEGRKEERKTI